MMEIIVHGLSLDSVSDIHQDLEDVFTGLHVLKNYEGVIRTKHELPGMVSYTV
jgi:hypothetical protein